MIITKNILNRDTIKKGVYIALRSMNQYCESNTYIPVWDVCDNEWLNNWQKEYQGWLPIKKVLKEFNTGECPVRYYIEKDGNLQYRKENTYTCANVVIVKYKQTNQLQYSPYAISNSIYYNSHLDQFEGWIDTEDIPIIISEGK